MSSSQTRVTNVTKSHNKHEKESLRLHLKKKDIYIAGVEQ